ncbi:DUF2510 domain-containing protein [Amycolatopsis sp. NPDC003731]
MAERVRTGCTNCKRCTNSAVAEFGRRQGKLWANVATAGGVAVVQAFTPNCRACGHKLSLHDRGGESRGNAYPAPVTAQPSARQGPPPGWYAHPGAPGVLRWWDGTRWTEHTQAPPR